MVRTTGCINHTRRTAGPGTYGWLFLYRLPLRDRYLRHLATSRTSTRRSDAARSEPHGTPKSVQSWGHTHRQALVSRVTEIIATAHMVRYEPSSCLQSKPLPSYLLTPIYRLDSVHVEKMGREYSSLETDSIRMNHVPPTPWRQLLWWQRI